MKPGTRTTEFWATFALCVGVVAAAVGDVLPARYAALAAAVSVAAYAIARGLAKIGTPVPVPVVPMPPATAPPPAPPTTAP